MRHQQDRIDYRASYPISLLIRSTVGRRAFPVSAANLRNSLPAHFTSAPSLAVSGSVLRLFSSGALLSETLRVYILLWTGSIFVIQAALKMSTLLLMMTISQTRHAIFSKPSGPIRPRLEMWAARGAYKKAQLSL